MGSGKKVTVGYRYYMGLHFGLCHGPVDAVYDIAIGDRNAWDGAQSASGAISITAPNLFGGDKREGGIVGTLDVAMGEPAQAANSYLTSKMSGVVPAFRGILSMVWRGGQVSSNNPYVKPWAFRVKRILQGWSTGAAWYPEKAEIGIPSSIDGYSYLVYASGGYNFDPNEAAPDPEDSPSTVVITGMAATDVLRISLVPDAGNAWSRWLGYGEGTGYYPGFITDPLWWAKISVKDSGGGVYRFFDTPAMTAAEANAANVAEIGYVTGSTSYQLWMEDDMLYNRGSLSVVVEQMRRTSCRQYDMNPAHIIYECLTDSEWGMGYPTGSIDNDSFTAAANALFAENFGLSFLWNRQETIENFIGIVLNHIGGILYVRPDTSTFALKLIRSDYDRGTLPIYGPSSLISVDDYQRQAWGETINEITVVYTDICSGKDVAITVQDAANVLAQGGVVAQQRNYPGIRQGVLAHRVALRDLNAASTPLAKIKLTATRAAWEVFPGDVFRLTWPEFEIDDVVYRALAVNSGTLTNGQIIIDAVEDVFGLPENTYLVDQPSEWEDPSSDPAAAPYRALLEAPYWDLARNLTAADLAYVDALSGYLETLAVRPAADATNYSIYARTGAADYAEAGLGDFCPSATIDGALGKTTTAITLSGGFDLDQVSSGTYAIIGDEYVLVSALDANAGTATISRGVLDTVPADHAAGARIWFADGWAGYSDNEYADGEALDVKLLPSTGRGQLDISLAPVDTLTFDQRQYRPYPPGNVKYAGSVSPAATAYPATITGELTITWAHRDRLTQTAYIVEQDEASIGPEAGTTYTVEIREGGSLVESASGIAGTSYAASVSGDSVEIEVTLYAMRDGLRSWQSHVHTMTITGDNNLLTEDGETLLAEDGSSILQE